MTRHFPSWIQLLAGRAPPLESQTPSTHGIQDGLPPSRTPTKTSEARLRATGTEASRETELLTARFSLFAVSRDNSAPDSQELNSRVLPRPDFVRPTFDQVYAETFPSVWRTARRLGVVESAVDDVVQEVFVTVYRRLDQFEGRCALKTWVFGILMRVVNNYRRTRRRKGAGHATSSVVGDPDVVVDAGADPLELASRSEAGRILHELLEKLDESKAAVFVLAEIEGMSVPEIAEATDTNVNTVYSRLRAARKEFERALKQRALRREARDG
jgi:RNA polymerase sigma-70 factor, ECF subfamily